MNRPISCLIPVALVATLTGGIAISQERVAAQSRQPSATPATTGLSDEEAIRAQARKFVEMFASGDAEAIAATWTDEAQYYEDGTITLTGRAAIEQAFAGFFQLYPGCRIEVQIESIRFPSRDLAVEEGTMLLTHDGTELPTSSRYSVLHVREDGQWKTAISQEWGMSEDRLQDLAWLIGDWEAASPAGEVRISFSWTEAKSGIDGQFSVTDEGRTVSSGHQRIIRDPQTGQLRSWMFDDDGGRGESLWYRDGNRWVLDAVGVSADGSETTAANVLTRLTNDEFVWRSINRAVGSDALPHTDPIKVTRVKAAE